MSDETAETAELRAPRRHYATTQDRADAETAMRVTETVPATMVESTTKPLELLVHKQTIWDVQKKGWTWAAAYMNIELNPHNMGAIMYARAGIGASVPMPNHYLGDMPSLRKYALVGIFDVTIVPGGQDMPPPPSMDGLRKGSKKWKELDKLWCAWEADQNWVRVKLWRPPEYHGLFHLPRTYMADLFRLSVPWVVIVQDGMAVHLRESRRLQLSESAIEEQSPLEQFIRFYHKPIATQLGVPVEQLPVPIGFRTLSILEVGRKVYAATTTPAYYFSTVSVEITFAVELVRDDTDHIICAADPEKGLPETSCTREAFFSAWEEAMRESTCEDVNYRGQLNTAFILETKQLVDIHSFGTYTETATVDDGKLVRTASFVHREDRNIEAHALFYSEWNAYDDPDDTKAYNDLVDGFSSDGWYI